MNRRSGPFDDLHNEPSHNGAHIRGDWTCVCVSVLRCARVRREVDWKCLIPTQVTSDPTA